MFPGPLLLWGWVLGQEIPARIRLSGEDHVVCAMEVMELVDRLSKITTVIQSVKGFLAFADRITKFFQSYWLANSRSRDWLERMTWCFMQKMPKHQVWVLIQWSYLCGNQFSALWCQNDVGLEAWPSLNFWKSKYGRLASRCEGEQGTWRVPCCRTTLTKQGDRLILHDERFQRLFHLSKGTGC